MPEPSLYVITHHKFNHHLGRLPLDRRLVDSRRNVIFFLIDEICPPQLTGRQVILEKQTDLVLAKAGKHYLGEWSFLLAEATHGFCQYPFFMVSSRFYEKNTWLNSDLDREWGRMFGFLEHYGWGYLPSYDRIWAWQDLQYYQQRGWLPVTARGQDLVRELYGVDVPGTYRYLSDFFCNYIGFQTREHLLAYVNFYRPLLERLFTAQFEPRDNLADYVGVTRYYRQEKPFTFFLELISHLFFYQNELKFFGMHYDGYYEVNERRTTIGKLDQLAPQPEAAGRPGRVVTAKAAGLEYRARTLLAHRWSPIRWLADGLLFIRLRHFFNRLLQKVP